MQDIVRCYRAIRLWSVFNWKTQRTPAIFFCFFNIWNLCKPLYPIDSMISRIGSCRLTVWNKQTRLSSQQTVASWVLQVVKTIERSLWSWGHHCTFPLSVIKIQMNKLWRYYFIRPNRNVIIIKKKHEFNTQSYNKKVALLEKTGWGTWLMEDVTLMLLDL